jgi:hypothetical protein
MEFDMGAAEAPGARPAQGQPVPGEQIDTAGADWGGAEGQAAASSGGGESGEASQRIGAAAQEGAWAEGEESAISGGRERGEASRLIGGTGQPSVDAALSGLRQLADLPVSEHAAVFERTHQRLLEVLGELDADLPNGTQDPTGGHDRPGAVEHDGS